jgi:CRISPR-associated protein Csm3
MQYELNKKIIIKGKIQALTGLAIGGSNSAMSIGGVDKGVIRNVATGEPYIPGSTLKGKMRSLLEMRLGEVGDKAMGVVKNGPCERDGARPVNLFGNASGTERQRPSRIIVRDALLDKVQKGSDFFKNTDLLYTEVKTEVVIDRITSKAMPRQMERVPAGALFVFEIVLNIFVQDGNEKQLVEDLFTALQLVQDDYIGGSGSRGSGQVSFHIESVVERGNAFYSEGKEEAIRTEAYKTLFPI